MRSMVRATQQTYWRLYFLTQRLSEKDKIPRKAHKKNKRKNRKEMKYRILQFAHFAKA
jgi:pyruvate/2-oxoacid:ferredoxin oxidoreductase beta subunit